MIEQEFKYGDIIEYIDCTEDLHFEAARDWAKQNNATFDELMDKRNLPKRYFQINEIIVPEPEPPTREEIEGRRRQLYIALKDPITCQIQSLKDEEQTEEIVAEIEALKQERADIVDKIRKENPYPDEI